MTGTASEHTASDHSRPLVLNSQNCTPYVPSATNAASRTVKNLFSLIAQLVAASVIGTLKIAPWQLLSEAFDIATLPARENVTVAPAPTACVRPVVLVKVTPVAASHPLP